MRRVSATDAKRDFSATLNRVAFGGERVVLQRHDKDIAALVSLEDLRLLQAFEDRMDAEAAREALSESDEHVSYSRVREELGLDRS